VRWNDLIPYRLVAGVVGLLGSYALACFRGSLIPDTLAYSKSIGIYIDYAVLGAVWVSTALWARKCNSTTSVLQCFALGRVALGSVLHSAITGSGIALFLIVINRCSPTGISVGRLLPPAIALTWPIVEECVLRGYLYGELRVCVSRSSAVTITLIVTMVVHHHVILEGYWQCVTVAGLGLLYCAYREITRSVWASISCHVAYNGVVSVDVLLQTS
jgi:membrane protease YdiL (CAAX protease family)